MSDAVMDRIEKQLEGNNLALSAVAEVLQKMDGKLSREEELAISKAEAEQEATDRQALIKEIASEVAGLLKDGDAGMDVDGEKVRPAAKVAGKGEDTEKPVNPTTKIEDQQATIQAMVKGASEDAPVEEEEDKQEKGGMAYKKADDADEKDDEEVDKDVDEDEEEMEKEGKEEDEDEDMEKMAKQLSELKKQLADYEANISKSVKVESENRLRKMGFKEENGLQAPKRIPLGVDGTTPIMKSSEHVDTVDQLAGLSYKELRDMQTKIESGDTDGVPRELLN